MAELKKHKQDKAVVYVLGKVREDDDWRTKTISEILWFDPGVYLVKHGFVSAWFGHKLQKVQMDDLTTISTFDGTYANSHRGICREELDLLDAFYNGLRHHTAEKTTLREARLEVFERAQRILDENRRDVTQQ